MKLSKLEKNQKKQITDYFSQNLISHPLLMFYCPDKNKRAGFIAAYFNFYLEKWAVAGNSFISESGKTVVSLIEKNDFDFHISGKNAIGLTFSYDTKNIFMHHEITQSIVEIMIPEKVDAYVMNLYGKIDENAAEIFVLIKDAMEKAKKENFVLVYETFSNRMVTALENIGFEVGYQRQFLNTLFVQTLMTYNF